MNRRLPDPRPAALVVLRSYLAREKSSYDGDRWMRVSAALQISPFAYFPLAQRAADRLSWALLGNLKRRLDDTSPGGGDGEG